MEKIGSENVNTNCGHSVLLEHDYSDIFFHNSDNNSNVNKVNERLENDKKFHTAFKTVDKWADSVSLRLPTGDDRKKIVDREITIHKVKYPFLPEQQIRGKVYKKFGIPTVMGGLLSRKRDPKKMADTKRWSSMQDLEVKPEIAAAETLDQVSINSQPTQIASFVAETRNNSSIEELRSFDDSKISKESMANLQEIGLEDLPTQSFELDWKKKILRRDINANFRTSDFPQSEKVRGKKRKNDVSPGTKTPEGEGTWKKMKISVPNDQKTTGRNTSQPELENSQGHDFVTLDHSYSSGLKKRSRKLPLFSVIARKSGQFMNENCESGESPIRDDFEDKENEENRFGEKDEEDVIILDEFSGLGKNIVLSPVVLSPVKKLAHDRPETVEFSLGKSLLKVNSSKCSRPYENSSKIDATAKLKGSTNFLSQKPSEISNNSKDICSPSSSSRRPNLFLVVDSLSNRCCEYDRDTTEISKFCSSANYFYNLELMSKNDPKIDKNAEEFEMRDKVDEILQSLQNEPL